MKKIILSVVAVLFTAIAIAQAPNKMSYQSVIRDAKGALLTSKDISVQISVLKDSKDGQAVYTELHSVKTNANGLISIEIGGGTASKGAFRDIDWSKGSYFIQTATDPNGGRNYSIIGVSELLSVPYALNARSADNGFSGNYNDLANRPLNLSQFVNDMGFITSQNTTTSRPTGGVPSQNWSLFGNRDSDSTQDKLGTTDFQDLVIVTNNLDRLHIQANGDIKLKNSLEIGQDLTVNKNAYLNVLGGQSINNGNFTVANASATKLTGTLKVTGITDLDSALHVNNAAPTHLTGRIDVDGAADLNTTLNVDGITDLNSALHVNNAAPTHLTGKIDVDGAADLNTTLNVDGITDLNSALHVNNAAPTHLTGLLDVDTTLNVDGATTLQSTLNVNNAAATALSGTLSVAKVTTLNDKLNANGQVTINTSVSGGEGSYGAYPLRVEGSAQGVAIKLTAGTPDNSNNFITFFNSGGSAVGRIEGETTSEATSDPQYIFDNSILVAEEIKAGVAVGLAAIPIPVELVVGQCAPCIAMAAADLVLATANIAAYNVFALENIGVTYQSGSADYAEWLERSVPGEKITAGDIVGVTGGKISKYTKEANQYMVISTKPAILGNMPMDGNERAYEKVAFMGQIPVKVKGIVVAGDYILPSGLNDGIGVAVAPSEIKAEQYRQIVGVAWSNALIAGSISTINMAIGLNNNDMANLAIQQENKIKALETKYNALEQRLSALETGKAITPSVSETAVATVPVAAKTISRNELLTSNMPAELSDKVMTDAINYLQNMYQSKGISMATHPGLNKLFNDAAFQAEVIKKAQASYKLSRQNVLATAQN